MQAPQRAERARSAASPGSRESGGFHAVRGSSSSGGVLAVTYSSNDAVSSNDSLFGGFDATGVRLQFAGEFAGLVGGQFDCVGVGGDLVEVSVVHLDL